MNSRDLLHPLDTYRQMFAPVNINISLGDCMDVLKEMPSDTYDCCVTSPPYYFVRDYDHASQIGMETSPIDFVNKLTAVFREVRRVMKPEATLWLNIGDNYCTRRAIRQDGKRTVVKGGAMPTWAESAKAGRTITGAQFRHLGIKEKDLFLTPHELAAALRNDGWWLRGVFHWIKTVTVPEKERDGPCDAVEYVFLLSKRPGDYVYNRDVLREYGSDGKGRAHRNVWEIAPSSYRSDHTATMPEGLAARCILTGSHSGGTVLDPFGGAGTTAVVAADFGRNCDVIELNSDFVPIIEQRIRRKNPMATIHHKLDSLMPAL